MMADIVTAYIIIMVVLYIVMGLYSYGPIWLWRYIVTALFSYGAI